MLSSFSLVSRCIICSDIRAHPCPTPFVGDNIFGNMSRVGPDSWYIGCYGVSPSGQKSQETVTTIKSRTRLTSQPWAYNTLECYGCRNCATYPTIPSVFTKLQLTQGSTAVAPAWLVNPKPSSDMKCKEGVAVASPSTQTIYFNGPPPPTAAPFPSE
jgi:hypothetical protein